MSERSDSGKCLNPTTTTLENSLLGMSNFRPDSHVAQQSRRDKLRVQQNSNPAFHIQDFPNHLIQLSREPGVNPDLIQVRNVRNCDLLYDSSIYSSEMLNFSTNAHVLLAQRDPMLHQETGPSSNPSYWKEGLGSHQSCDWIVNHVNGSQTNACNESPSFVGGSLSGTATVKGNSVSSSNLYSKPGYNGLQPSLTHPSSEISCQDSQKQYGVMHDSSFYQNTLQEVVTSSTIGSQGFEMASAVQQNVRETGSWVDGGNELAVLPAYGNQNSSLKVGIVDGSHMWNSELGFVGNKSGGEIGTFVGDSTAQGLSLSLSSHGPQFGERFGSEELQSRTNVFNGSRDSKTTSSGYLCSSSKSPHGAKGYGSSIQGIVSSSTYACPLGPFTGYATILKSSKFLKPAQQLLDEFCSVTGPNLITFEVTEKGSRDMISSCDTVNTEHEIGARGRSSGVSSCSFYSSVEASGEGGVGNGSYQSYHPEFQQRKAKLLFMQEEVCRRYKQYHQQMQMVVSSFESVAGLSAATPYTSLALKTVSRHFRCLKNAISDQLRHICRALGEDLSSPTTGTSSSKGDTMMPRLRLIDQGLQKHKSGADSLGFQEAQHHVWRPQRGLPERSVAVLRAWLFEHFLHPYPTDTDKHMLATQTGLSRNQVSNWFINARVRLWKPMIEEIHMLETKGSAETNLNPGKNNGKPATNSDNEPVGDHPSNQSVIDAMSEKRSECSGVGSMSNAEDDRSSELYNQEKRSRMEHQFPAGVDGGLMGFMPCHQGSLEMGGLGAVSLTLGLRQNTESSQHQQQQQGHQLIRHFGGQMIHDFVG